VKHYSLISSFYKNNSASIVEKFDFESLVDLVYSDSKKKIFFYNDALYTKIVDGIDLGFGENQILILSPENHSPNLAPPGFNQYNIHSIDYFTKTYSAFKDDVQAIFCPFSQKSITINKGVYDVFEINSETSYENLLNFCKAKYEKKDMIDGFNQYAKRGGLIDIYPSGNKNPKRVSFLGDKTEIKDFNLDSQRSFHLVDSFKVATLQSKKTLGALLLDECSNWSQYQIEDDQIVINNNINSEKNTFPFKKINYSEFKKLQYHNKVIYEDVNRLNGFVYNEQVIVPFWFKKTAKKLEKNKIVDIATIAIGDYVVHRDYGVGSFLGLKYIDANKSTPDQELIVIKYLDGNITVDINHLDKVTFYGSKNELVNIDSLSNSGKWTRRKKSAKKNVQNIVNKLVNAYVNREKSHRDPITAVKEENQFIKEFEYLETVDQTKCWNDINDDLQSSAPMDRLICGDVGFGKTELAIRTAYRYVSNSKKVVVLAPTTILSEQLFHSFRYRMKNHGIIIDRISRLRNKKEIEKIKDCWINNQLDIVIGTHAVLYNEIYLNYSDLLIIDEEHRFGVQQKEKIKELNPSIDILTMSATPIPRTLNMALSGMKQISTLSSAPKYRKAIITNINYFNDQLITNAINNEIIRNGQVYFVHNNVKTIGTIVNFLEKKLPHLKIEYIHGQMDSKIIEKRMKNFTNNDIDVLVCTSIIENGIDISSVNTIIINNAHEFGLSQLYQIRGRVGRSNQQAYALLIIPEKFRLTPTSRLRLKTIEKYTSLGSGYKISNMDLTIRGGGSIFGYDQSGNIENVGYELVSKFINEYMHENQSNIPITNIRLINKGIIPTEYINSEKIRLLVYRKIKSIVSLHEIDNLLDELLDRFGKIPKELMQIIEVQKLQIQSQKKYIRRIEERQNNITIQFTRNYWEQKVSYLLNKINKFIHQQSINYEIEESKESLILKLQNIKENESVGVIKKLINIL